MKGSRYSDSRSFVFRLDPERREMDRLVWSIRDCLRRDGVTGKDALMVVVAFVAIEEFEKKHEASLRDLKLYDDGDDFMTPDRSQMVLGGFKALRQSADNILGMSERLFDLYYQNAIITHQADIIRRNLKGIRSPKPETQREVLRLLDDLPREGDLFSEMYVSIVKDFLSGSKDLGQFFTPQAVIDFALEIASMDRELGIVFDPTCGTGGFLIAALHRGAREVTGCEIDRNVHLIAQTNLALHGSLGEIRSVDFLEDTKVPGSAYDTLLANPPFGMKGIKWQKSECFPFKTTATGLFLEKMIWSLKPGGRGCVVLPLGSELQGKKPAEIAFRQALFESLYIQCLIVVPEGTFENTTIRTAILCFDKMRDLGEPGPLSSTGLMIRGLNWEAIEGLPETIPVETVREHGWSLNPSEYIVREEKASEFPMVRLGDLVDLKKGKIQATKVIPGPNPVISIGEGKTHNEATDDGEVLAIADGSGGFNLAYHRGPCTITTLMARIIPKVPLNVRYLYYLLDNDPEIKTMKAGLTQRALDRDRFFSLSVPMPPLEIQAEIAAKCEETEAEIGALEKSRDAALQTLTKFVRSSLFDKGMWGHMMRVGQRTTYSLGDLVTIERGQAITKPQLQEGNVLVVGGGKSPFGTHNEANTEAGTILMSATGAGAGYISRYSTPIFASVACHKIIPKDPSMRDYLYYVLKYAFEPTLMTFQKGVAQPHLDLEKVLDLRIPVPQEPDRLNIVNQGLTLETTIINLEVAIGIAHQTLETSLRSLTT